MNKVLLITAVAFSIVQLTGCSHMTVLRTQELREVQAKVDSLHANLTTLQLQLLEEQKSSIEMLRLLRADQQVRFNEVERKVSAIQNNLSESQNRLSRIDQKTTEVSQKLTAKINSDSDAEAARKLEVEKLFQIAMSDFNAGRYDLAVSGLKDLVSQFPGTPQATESEYWIAECFYAKKEFENAEKAYIDFIRKYSDSPRICVSLYKLGLAYERQEKVKSKELAWRKLVQQCPEAQEAQVVKTQLAPQ